jgi:hypothetical protein
VLQNFCTRCAKDICPTSLYTTSASHSTPPPPSASKALARCAWRSYISTRPAAYCNVSTSRLGPLALGSSLCHQDFSCGPPTQVFLRTLSSLILKLHQAKHNLISKFFGDELPKNKLQICWYMYSINSIKL